MFYIIYKKSDRTVLFTKHDMSTGFRNTMEEILNAICSDRQVDASEYIIEESLVLEGIRTDGSQIYDPVSKTLSDNPAYVPPPAIESNSLPVTDISQVA